MIAGIFGVFAILGWAIVMAVSWTAIGIWKGVAALVKLIIRMREARRRRFEAELDRTQEQLRTTILQLADALGAEAHEARKALIRESYLASGTTPPRRSE